MKADGESSRREFVTGAAALTLASVFPHAAAAVPPTHADATLQGRWDLGWLRVVEQATDRAVFDWPSLGSAADPIMISLADRYLQNCDSVYGAGKASVAVVLNIRTQAVPAALKDELWERYDLGTENKTNDPHTSQVARRNPFWHAAPDILPGIPTPSLSSMVDRGAVFLVCDFALGHLATRLAKAKGGSESDVHEELLGGLVPRAYAVPSGIYGLAKAQNAGCALVRL